MMNSASENLFELPAEVHRGFLMLTTSWPGERVRPKSLLIRVHECPNATQLPLIWCGTAEELAWIVPIVGKERSVYGLRGYYDYARPTEHLICSLSNYYVKEILYALPQEPYLIAGYCSSAFLAIEIASQLEQRGHAIGFLALLERDVTDHSKVHMVTREITLRWDRFATDFYDLLHDCRKRKLIDNYRFILRLSRRLLSPRPQQVFPDESELLYKQNKNMPMYRIRPYAGKVYLCFVRWGVFGYYQLDYFQQAWRKLAPNGVVFDFIPGMTHKYANWALMIKKLKFRLNEAGF